MDQGGTFRQGQAEVTVRLCPWLQRVFEHAFCLCLVSFCFSKLNDGRSGAPGSVNNSWFSNSFCLRQSECFSHALVLGVVTPRQSASSVLL